MGGWELGVPPHMCTFMHMHTCMRGKHDNFMQLATPLGESLGIPYDVIHMCACMCVCAHVCGAPFHHPTPTPQGGPQESIKIQ